MALTSQLSNPKNKNKKILKMWGKLLTGREAMHKNMRITARWVVGGGGGWRRGGRDMLLISFLVNIGVVMATDESSHARYQQGRDAVRVAAASVLCKCVHGIKRDEEPDPS